MDALLHTATAQGLLRRIPSLEPSTVYACLRSMELLLSESELDRLCSYAMMHSLRAGIRAVLLPGEDRLQRHSAWSIFLDTWVTQGMAPVSPLRSCVCLVSEKKPPFQRTDPHMNRCLIGLLLVLFTQRSTQSLTMWLSVGPIAADELGGNSRKKILPPWLHVSGA